VWRESRRPGAEPGLVLSWLLRCQIPLTVYALLVYWIMRVVPQATVGVIVMMMGAGLPLAGYGWMLRHEGETELT
jgi:xanthine/uracil permease